MKRLLEWVLSICFPVQEIGFIDDTDVDDDDLDAAHIISILRYKKGGR